MSLPHLVLLPGMDGTGQLFKPFVDALGSSVTTTIADYASPEISRYSECRVAAERKLPRAQPYVLVGESFSGPIAVSIAAGHPPGLRGLVLVGTFVSSPSWALTALASFIDLLPTHGPQRLTASLLLGRHATPELSRLLQTALAHVSPRASRGRLREIAKVNVAQALSAVRVPILYLRATDDRIVPQSCGDEVMRLAPHATIADLAAPHMILQCKPAECATLIEDFARRCCTPG